MNKTNKMNKTLSIIAGCFASLFLAGCIPVDHYRFHAGAVELVRWDEGNGTLYMPVKGADIATFKQFPHCAYATDRSHVYFDGNIIPGADPAGFHRLKDYYWTDNARVYYFGKLIPGADPRSFRYLAYEVWWRDDHDIYVQDTPLHVKDLATFELLDAHWARDSKWYYPVSIDQYTPIDRLDRATFRILRAGWARDRDRVFYYDKIVNVYDMKTFRLIDDERACDSKWFYDTFWRRETVEAALKDGLMKNVPPLDPSTTSSNNPPP